MDNSLRNQVRLIVVDLRNSLKNDYRFITICKSLHDVTTMAYVMAASSSWSHFGIVVVREDNTTVLQNLQEFGKLSMNQLDETFRQLNQSIDSAIDVAFVCHYGDSSGKKPWDLNRTFQNALKQYRELKAPKGEFCITVITLQWEIYAKAEIREFQRNNGRSNTAYSIQVLNIDDCAYQTERFGDKLVVTTVPRRGITIVLEAVLKAWIKGKSKALLLVFPGKDIDFTCQVENPLIDLQAISTELTNPPMSIEAPFPRKLNIYSFINATALCPSLMYGQCYSVSPVISRAENYNRYEALWRFIEEKQVAIIARADEEKARTFAIFPGSELRMILQPIASSEFVLPIALDEELLISRPINGFEHLAHRLPVSDRYDLGVEGNLIDYVKATGSAKHQLDTSLQLLENEGRKNTCRPKVTARKSSRPQGKKSQTRPTETRRVLSNGVQEFHAHPALGMYKCLD